MSIIKHFSFEEYKQYLQKNNVEDKEMQEIMGRAVLKKQLRKKNPQTTLFDYGE